MIGKTITHYKILEHLGSGGMGVVYKAEDIKLKRHVALKFLPPELTENPDAKQRFIREAQAASTLQHHNICTIHEIGETDDDQMYIVMDYYEGETIKLKIEKRKLNITGADLRARPVSPKEWIDDAIDITTQIVEGLAQAHEKGIAHRDIKPANIFITNDGMIKILDFGLAKLSGQSQLTKDSSTLGTVAYMSPEQLSGKEVDQRTDIWSLGVVLYEMLTGELPFNGEYEQAVTYAILNENPKRITQMRSDIPKNIEQIISKSLEKNRDKRYQNILDIVNDLQAHPDFELTPEKQEKSIIALPFVNMSPDPDQEYFSDGLTEEIITDLSQIHNLLVISRSSAMTFKGTKKKVKEIAKEVNVQYVLEGSVRKVDNNLRITAQLINAETDIHMWAKKFDGTLDNVFDIQEKVSRSIVEALKIKLHFEEEKKITQHPIHDVQAFELYLKARQEIWKWTEDSMGRALLYLQNGLDIIGDNTLLYFGMGYVYWTYINIGFKDKEECLKKAEKYAKKIFEMNPNSEHGNLLMGLIYFRSAQLQKGVVHFKKALQINPNNPDALHWICILYSNAGQTEAAWPLVRKLLKIDPLTAMNYIIPAWLYMLEADFSKSLELFFKAYRMDPKTPPIRFVYCLSLVYNQRLEEAYSLFDEHYKEMPENIWAQMGLCFKCALQGEKEKALQLMSDGLKNQARCDLFDSWVIAVCDALLGEKNEAIDSLETAVNLGAIYYPFFSKLDPLLKNIRGEERFQKLMQRVKVEWKNFEV